MDFLKKLSKQAIAAGIIGMIIFFVWPGATTLFFAGIAVGIIAGNLYEPLEALAEKAINKASG